MKMKLSIYDELKKVVLILAEMYFIGQEECYIHFYYRRNEIVVKELHILVVKCNKKCYKKIGKKVLKSENL